jgi:hypothetical protein
MPPAIQAFWNKLNANEKLVMYGVAGVVIAFLVGVAAGGYFGGTGSFGLIGAIAITVIYWLKYSNSTINWPAPIQTIVLGIAGIDAILALLSLLSWLGFFGIGLFALAVVINAIGCGLMAWGAWKEYQAMPKAAPPSTPPAPPAPPAA